eukprot:7591968-Alexandrium_andersonii.AAC.1
MSASLVGSEMCIRDSLGLLRPLSCAARGGRTSSSRGARHRCRGCLHAVSYTHLTLPTICSV